MTSVTYICPSGAKVEIDVQRDTTVMRAGVEKNVEGIVAECGGVLACATCHVYVDEACLGNFSEPTSEELEMLEYAPTEVRPTSRLSCQLAVKAGQPDVVVTVAPNA
jgi:2Fe-2S ferredoxin